ncbi:probable phenylalanine--tRNA ligase, mitochondrial [Schistocerca piceifrons]|uniref:probable phenylalanine--tRNA ligase, mitochondrial n=1 Tax=Schistocerca piceifrons TaxID=274613 RepID=UPI001F5FDDAF|nr:probable phenylalanine--tRNA ligase, mitochondrial [Schistocerca piceifrons]
MVRKLASFFPKSPIRCSFSTVNETKPLSNIEIKGKSYSRDEWTNVTPKVLSYIGKNLHSQPGHPLHLVKKRIVNYMYKTFVGRRGNPLFAVFDDLSPVVTVEQNFDSLLVPHDHPSRQKSDCYYINRSNLLRAHTTAHQSELIGSGLNNFLIIGDVYRRDEIDSKHYPAFHQVDAVRICTPEEVFRHEGSMQAVFEKKSQRTAAKQACHTLAATKHMEHELKQTLEGLAETLFGSGFQYRWVDTTFPFTHPSWELEVLRDDNWMEILGCGIMENEILESAGVKGRIGWAFGLGLERLAMCLYSIPDIRLFWSSDSGFLSQFNVKDPDTQIKYKPISIYPQCTNDISFWLPSDDSFTPNDFYDLVRTVGGDVIEQISLIDEFTHKKKGLKSHCYRIVYRHMGRTLTQKEVNEIHNSIARMAEEILGVTIR